MNHVASLRTDIRLWKYILKERYFSQNISKKKVEGRDLRQTVLFKIIIFFKNLFSSFLLLTFYIYFILLCFFYTLYVCTFFF